MKRHLATIMLVDICGFTALSATTDTSSMFSLLQEVEALVIATCQNFQGEILKKVGDAVLVLFPSASQALKSAQRVHMELQNRGLHSDVVHPTSVKIAIASGDVTVRQQEVYGTPVRVVFELEKQALKDTTLLCESTWSILPPNNFPCVPVNRRKGKLFEGNKLTFQLVQERHGEYMVAPAAPTHRILASLLDLWVAILILLLLSVGPSLGAQFTYWLSRTRISIQDFRVSEAETSLTHTSFELNSLNGRYHIIVGGSFQDASTAPSHQIRLAEKEFTVRNSLGLPHTFMKTLARDVQISGKESLLLTYLPQKFRRATLAYIDFLPTSAFASPPNIFNGADLDTSSYTKVSGISGYLFLTLHSFVKVYLGYLIITQLLLSKTIGGWLMGIKIRDVHTKQRIGVSATLLRTLACLATPLWCWGYLGERRQPIDSFSATEVVHYFSEVAP
jgi:class 3 adenylate cyclase